jgi:hypothetical protein
MHSRAAAADAAVAAAAVKYSKPDIGGPVPLKKMTVPEALLMDLFGSSCLPCLSVCGSSLAPCASRSHSRVCPDTC